MSRSRPPRRAARGTSADPPYPTPSASNWRSFIESLWRESGYSRKPFGHHLELRAKGDAAMRRELERIGLPTLIARLERGAEPLSVTPDTSLDAAIGDAAAVLSRLAGELPELPQALTDIRALKRDTDMPALRAAFETLARNSPATGMR